MSNMGKLRLALIIIFVIVVSVVAAELLSGEGAKVHLHETPVPFEILLVDENVTVNAGTYLDYQFTIPSDAQSISLSLGFTAQGGDNDIKVYVFDSTDFSYYQSGQNYTSLYQSGQITTAGFSMNIPTNGTWYLVLDNKFSMVQKTVNINSAVFYFTPQSVANALSAKENFVEYLPTKFY